MNVDKQEDGFVPVRVSFTIETEAELQALWHGLREVSVDEAHKDAFLEPADLPCGELLQWPLWDHIDDIALKLALRNT